MGDYLSPRKQQVFVRLRERIDKVRKSNEQSLRIFEASNPQRREQERQDTQEFHRRIIENRNKRAPRSVKAQESGQSKVKSESNGNCSNSEMGRNQPQVVKKAVDRKRPNPDSPNLTGTTEAINRTSALSLEASSSSSGMRGDASPAKKPCVDSKQLAPGQVPTPNQYIQQQDPNRMGASNHPAQLTDNGVGNQAAHGASGGDNIEDVQGLDLLSDIDNSGVLRLLDDPNGAHLDDMIKSGQFNPETLLSELSRIESNLSMQLGEIHDTATNSPGSQDASKQSDMKPGSASNNAETGVVPKSENSDTYDPMMEGPPNTVATDALQKSGPLPSIHEFKPSSGKGVLVKQEPQQINVSRATFNGQNVQTVTSSGAQNIVPQVNQLTPMQATGTSASAMNSSMRGSFINQQSGMSGQQGNFLSAQQQQLSSRQFLPNARMPSQQSHHSRIPNSMLSNNMNASMSSADQLSQFANNSMRGQSSQHGRLPGLQSFIPNCNSPMALSSGQGGNMMPGQASQFVQHSQQQQQRMASTEILQRLQKPPHYNASAEQRKFVTNSYVQSPQQGHNMQQGNSQMLIHRPPPPRYDETQHRNSMAFQGPVNQGMQQQLGQQAGMMTHMVGQPNIRSMVPGQGVQGHLNNGMSASAGNRGMMQGMAQQQPQQQGMMPRLTHQIRRQILQQRAMQQQSSAMGNQMNMASISPGVVNIGQAGVAQYQQRHMPGQWSANQILQHRMQQQNNSFQGNNMMQQQQQQPYSSQQRFPQRNVMDSNMRTFQNITSQGGMSNVTNTNPSIMAQQQFVGQPAQSQQQQTQQPTQQQQQQQPQQQQGTMQQPVQGNSITAMQNGSAVSGTNQSFGNNAQQMPMGMMLDSNSQQQQQQQSGSSDMLDLLDNIIKNDGTARTNSHV